MTEVEPPPTDSRFAAAREPGDLHPGHLLWRCRRGMKELDVLLERYARSRLLLGGSEKAVGSSEQRRRNAEQCRRFARLLELPDPVLADYLLGHASPPDPQLRELARQITHPADASGSFP